MNYNKNIPDLVKNLKRIAVIGASNDEGKYGYRIYKDLKGKGYEVFPVNNKHETIQGDKNYKSISELVGKVDVLDFVVPPVISRQIAEEAVSLGFKNLWFQPGSSDDAVVEYLKDLDINVVDGPCIMVETDKFIGIQQSQLPHHE